MIIIFENTQQTNVKDGGIIYGRVNALQETDDVTSQVPADNQPITTVKIVLIGAVVIFIGGVALLIKHFYKKRIKRKKDLEDSNMEIIPITEPIPKKTAADHLGELKKALQPLKLGSSGSSLSEERGSNNSIKSIRSSKSNVELTPMSQQISTSATRIGSSRGSLSPRKLSSLLPLSPPPPPSTPLKYQYDDIEPDPIRISLLDALLLDYITPPSSINTSTRSSRRQSIANSRTISSLPRPLSENSRPRERLSRKRSMQNIQKYNKDINFDITDFQSIQDFAIQIAQSEKITPTETEVHSSNSS